MKDIILATINTRYPQTAFGLRYLKANLGHFQSRCEILEFTTKELVQSMAAKIVSRRPRYLGLGVYIWNTLQSRQLLLLLREIDSSIRLIIGGPEVSHELGESEFLPLVDHIITGEADLAFHRLVTDLENGKKGIQKVIKPEPVILSEIELPYHLYTDEDIANRKIFVEASRGCVFKCEFCLSSLDSGVNKFDIQHFLNEIEILWQRGAREFKFIDRTFNLSLRFSLGILEFFLEKQPADFFLHFEMVPDKFPDELKEVVKKFSPGQLQFEVGIQTFNEDVAALISRRQNYTKLKENLQFLQKETGVHLHTDLIVGLPGETLQSFGAGFDTLVSYGVQEIQVGILKRLKGTPITRHTREFGMSYSPLPPFEILFNRNIDYETMERLKRFARFWDIFNNSGNFKHSLKLTWQGGSAFYSFLTFSDWLYAELEKTHEISQSNQFRLLLTYLTIIKKYDESFVLAILKKDFEKVPGRKLPVFLKGQGKPRGNRRQLRHTQ